VKVAAEEKCSKAQLMAILGRFGDFVNKVRFGIPPGFREWDMLGNRDRLITAVDVNALCDLYDGGTMSTQQCSSLTKEPTECAKAKGCSYDGERERCTGTLEAASKTALPIGTAKCPLVRAAMQKMDTNDDKKVDAHEFAANEDVARSISDSLYTPPDALLLQYHQRFRKEIDSVRKQLKELGADPDSITAGKDLDVDSGGDMPYGELEPFGREDTAQEVTTQSIGEQDEMVDQLERAEVAEEKRAVFRALTRLRGAVITAYDGIARTQSANIDEYNKKNKWRDAHPMHHLAEEEADYEKWAFPPPPEPYAQLANGPAAAPAAAEAKASAPAAAA